MLYPMGHRNWNGHRQLHPAAQQAHTIFSFPNMMLEADNAAVDVMRYADADDFLLTIVCYVSIPI